MLTPKSLFLVAYDYGMGGLWGVLHARSAEEIVQLWPELTVVEDRPPWMDEVRYANIVQVESHDIDDAPSGLLAVILDDRKRRKGQ